MEPLTWKLLVSNMQNDILRVTIQNDQKQQEVKIIFSYLQLSHQLKLRVQDFLWGTVSSLGFRTTQTSNLRIKAHMTYKPYVELDLQQLISRIPFIHASN